MAQKVLVIDDSPIVRNLHSVMLKSAGYIVAEAENGYDGLEKAMSTHYDLMVVDINMPKMDGFTFCREIRSSEEHKNVPIIIVSTEAEAEDKMQGFKAGANLYLVKPVKADQLIQNAKMLLG
ncbi:MAG: two-component system response regulator [Candidatus Lambdaproteobacteria bacterium RIFOXYD1_FULL_56_27]|uniref:Two-component system response regulator n=1 Tax=Candidatus Lambdaproteobacteria bacterium RIFOXYD2_FULL_56_26 TaxID=1817773 RepID=A0A1F6GPP9_9PROT|nr:MAG: two-component system response regulator [Candidatus Lambdaproteobacteria bacterium RIFOXYD2_FULL_56_26]OGH03923.1 MAG: two-component system response regulator [Candidatus Lambdaproteobacteria bacterium RIFOXYC1_FULL_56_13]OGH06180.1 MAG: two-component system response regulator [Candidatus Lambdaproteobacteria bacterium RIFOXYD1_FULL_56_27]